MFTLAHLSDIHLPPLPGLRLRDIRLKRLTGFANWHHKRKHLHLRATLDAIVSDIQAQQPDHIAVTGDLVNIGLQQEHDAALDWLRSVGRPEDVSVVPGNHDAYVRMPRDAGFMRWRDYMMSNPQGAVLAAGATDQSEAGFPYVRRFGGVVIIGLCSGVPTPPIVAAGRLGRKQLSRLADLLALAGRHNLVRVVLIHHPPLPGQAPWLRALERAKHVAAVLSEHGAELVLHGHNHRNSLAWCPLAGGDKAVPVVGVASASIGVYRHEPLARYNLFRLRQADARIELELTTRGLAQAGGPVVELERKMVEV